MTLLQNLRDVSAAMRLVHLEMLASDEVIEGDFKGSVTGKWVQLAPNGSGVVEYNSKLYYTKPIGFTSIPAGTAVELTFANGVYYSKW